jgi:hypothetical protein
MVTQNTGDVTRNVEEILKSLPHCSIDDLRQRWRVLFGAEPPPAFGPDLLRRSIAHKLQENTHGKLSASAQRELNRIVTLMGKNPAARIEAPRRIKAGAVLVRDWDTKAHCVTVLDDGFAYDGHTYASLSEIAREITGTNWNGPRFFGLRPNSKKSVNEMATAKRGRPARISENKWPLPPEADHGL